MAYMSSSLNSSLSSSGPQLVAHRGYSLRYPENTLLAIKAAVEAGARYVEFDVLLTKDHEPVLFHDRDLQRMCGQPGAIHDYSLAELKRFSVSEFGKFGYKFVGNPITTLQELVGYLKTVPAVVAFVEIKRQSLQTFGIESVLNKILPIISTMPDQVVVISYSLEALLATRERSSIPVAAVFDDWRDRKQAMIQKLKPEFMFTDIELLPRFGKLACPQCELAVYECTDPEQAIKVHKRGVSLVETFAIAEMLQALKLSSENR